MTFSNMINAEFKRIGVSEFISTTHEEKESHTALNGFFKQITFTTVLKSKDFGDHALLDPSRVLAVLKQIKPVDSREARQEAIRIFYVTSMMEGGLNT